MCDNLHKDYLYSLTVVLFIIGLSIKVAKSLHEHKGLQKYSFHTLKQSRSGKIFIFMYLKKSKHETNGFCIILHLVIETN